MVQSYISLPPGCIRPLTKHFTLYAYVENSNAIVTNCSRWFLVMFSIHKSSKYYMFLSLVRLTTLDLVLKPLSVELRRCESGILGRENHSGIIQTICNRSLSIWYSNRSRCCGYLEFDAKFESSNFTFYFSYVFKIGCCWCMSDCS